MHAKSIRSLAAAVLIAAFATACGDQSPEATGNVDVTLAKTDAVIAQVVSGWYASVVAGETSTTMVDPDTVETLTVRVTTLQFLPQGRDEADNGAWVTLDLDEPALLDLMALPSEDASPIVIASGTVEVGTYANVRLFTDSASIRFKGPITVGAAITFEGGVDHLVEIPSGEQTGINTNATFTVEADAADNVNDVNLLFSSGSTLQNVTATGNDRVIMTPVIHERGDGGA